MPVASRHGDGGASSPLASLAVKVSEGGKPHGVFPVRRRAPARRRAPPNFVDAAHLSPRQRHHAGLTHIDNPTRRSRRLAVDFGMNVVPVAVVGVMRRRRRKTRKRRRPSYLEEQQSAGEAARHSAVLLEPPRDLVQTSVREDVAPGQRRLLPLRPKAAHGVQHRLARTREDGGGAGVRTRRLSPRQPTASEPVTWLPGTTQQEKGTPQASKPGLASEHSK